MKILEKIFFKKVLLIAFFIPAFCFGQKPAFGIKLGLAVSNSTIKSIYAVTYNHSSRTGLLGGIYADIPHSNLIFRPGVEIVSKGRKESGFPVVFTFVDFPVSILYKTDFSNGRLLAGGGPSIGFPISDYYGNYLLKTEFGINGMIGYEVPIGFSVNLNYSYGLSNASNNKELYRKISNRYLGITFGYTF